LFVESSRSRKLDEGAGRENANCLLRPPKKKENCRHNKFRKGQVKVHLNAARASVGVIKLVMLLSVQAIQMRVRGRLLPT